MRTQFMPRKQGHIHQTLMKCCEEVSENQKHSHNNPMTMGHTVDGSELRLTTFYMYEILKILVDKLPTLPGLPDF